MVSLLFACFYFIAMIFLLSQNDKVIKKKVIKGNENDFKENIFNHFVYTLTIFYERFRKINGRRHFRVLAYLNELYQKKIIC